MTVWMPDAERWLVVGIEPAVQQIEVAGVDVAFQSLYPVAGPHGLPLGAVRLRQHVPFQVWERGRLGARPQVGPDDTVSLSAGVRPCLHLVLEVALGRLVRHVDAVTGDIELPAVIDAPQSGFLVASKKQ